MIKIFIVLETGYWDDDEVLLTYTLAEVFHKDTDREVHHDEFDPKKIDEYYILNEDRCDGCCPEDNVFYYRPKKNDKKILDRTY